MRGCHVADEGWLEGDVGEPHHAGCPNDEEGGCESNSDPISTASAFSSNKHTPLLANRPGLLCHLKTRLLIVDINGGDQLAQCFPGSLHLAIANRPLVECNDNDLGLSLVVFDGLDVVGAWQPSRYQQLFPVLFKTTKEKLKEGCEIDIGIHESVIGSLACLIHDIHLAKDSHRLACLKSSSS